MDSYISNYDTLSKRVVYTYGIGDGGIGDILKSFMYLLDVCIQNNIKLCYLSNGSFDTYLKLRMPQMYITEDKIFNPEYNTYDILYIRKIEELAELDTDAIYIVRPQLMYQVDNIYDKLQYTVNSVFYFTEEVQSRAYNFIGSEPYSSIHLRLGDKYLETDPKFVICHGDARVYDESAIFRYIEATTKRLVFFCDNTAYKQKIKDKYPHVYITDYEIGHTSLSNTSELQLLNAMTEFYLLSCSQHIYSASNSGFSMMASKFQGVPISFPKNKLFTER